MKRSSAELKQLARELLEGKYGTFIGTYIIMSLITSAIVFLPAMLYQGSSISAIVVRQIISFIVSLVITIINIGMLQLSLNVSRHKDFGVADLFYGFRHQPDRIIVAAFFCQLINLLYSLPYSLLLGYVANRTDFRTATVSNLNIVLIGAPIALVGMIISYFILLRFQLAFYLLLDNEDMSGIESLRTSAKLMKGNKGRYFYLELSFIGMTLLGILSFGIGLLWIYPYMTMTITQFYREAIGELDKEQPTRTYPTDLY